MPNPCEQCTTTYESTKASLMAQFNSGAINIETYAAQIKAAFDTWKACLSANGCLDSSGFYTGGQ